MKGLWLIFILKHYNEWLEPGPVGYEWTTLTTSLLSQVEKKVNYITL